MWRTRTQLLSLLPCFRRRGNTTRLEASRNNKRMSSHDSASSLEENSGRVEQRLEADTYTDTEAREDWAGGGDPGRGDPGDLPVPDTPGQSIDEDNDILCPHTLHGRIECRLYTSGPGPLLESSCHSCDCRPTRLRLGRTCSLSLFDSNSRYVQYSSAYREPCPARRTTPPPRPSLPPLCPETLAPSVLQRVIQINLQTHQDPTTHRPSPIGPGHGRSTRSLKRTGGGGGSRRPVPWSVPSHATTASNPDRQSPESGGAIDRAGRRAAATNER